ncbi:hypothetical protein FN846DRAFT_58690 [Sphaerosporella brunnea]|uniref:Uncharacterized protein n=1 Tax=Sphaerosporella brunnea TaxID=1250544 RepID=A0A5J5FAC1_9PEZI|nr:hypothetical protein FN846DRAFT_58690 [Sphaerosporella brunnea]
MHWKEGARTHNPVWRGETGSITSLFMVAQMMVDDVLGGSLRQSEPSQSLNGHTASADATDSREHRVVPASREALVDEPRQLALTEESLGKAESREVLDVNLPQTQGLKEPPVLRVTITVFDGPQNVSDLLLLCFLLHLFLLIPEVAIQSIIQ